MWYILFSSLIFFSIGFVYHYYVNPIVIKTFPVEKEVPQIVGSFWEPADNEVCDVIDKYYKIMKYQNEEIFEVQKAIDNLFNERTYHYKVRK